MMSQKMPFAPCREVKTSVWGGQTLRVGRSVTPCRGKWHPFWGDAIPLKGTPNPPSGDTKFPLSGRQPVKGLRCAA